MDFRTDLAMEARDIYGSSRGISAETVSVSGLRISRMHIYSPEAARSIGKPAGHYITIEGLPETDNFREVRREIEAIAGELENLLPKEGSILVVGIGNTEITPDALGPASAASVIATRHIGGEIAKSAGLDRLRNVADNEFGRITYTALASRSLSHLGRTIQLSDSGITPGSGIGNRRFGLTRDNLGIPVIGIGMPTVVDAVTLAKDISGADAPPLPSLSRTLIVTPKEIDILNRRASKLIGMAVNCALQREYDFDELACLVS